MPLGALAATLLIGVVLWLIPAYLVWKAGSRYTLLAVGFLLRALQGFLFPLAQSDVLTFETMSRLSTVVGVVSLLFIIAGALKIAALPSGSAQRAATLRPYVNPAGRPMESLIIPRNATNSFTRAETLRDQLYARIEEECKVGGLKVVGYKSHARSGTVWARFDFILPQDSENLSLRSGLRIEVERFDYHRFEHLIALELQHGTQNKRLTGLIELDDRDSLAITQYLGAGGPFPELLSRRVRVWPFQLWRPANRVDRLRPDWLTIGWGVGSILLFAVPGVGGLGIVFGIGSLLALRWFNKRRKTYILTTGKPLHDPRQLIRMDSWQATVNRLGARNRQVRDALLERLRSTAEQEIRIEPERIWYPGVDGKVEREQIVCTFRRAIAFVHLEAYGDDLYVGWDSHVNGATWVEQTLARGVDRQSSRLVVANRVVPGWQVPNEYDITDVNFLTEWLHAGIVRLIRLTMEEHRIDQEIDFKIQRESRKAAVGAQQPEDGTSVPALAGAGALMSRLRRVS